jgi:hypothetical protein
MDLYGFRDDVVEIVARVILHKDEQAKGITCPNTDNWLDLYNGKRGAEEKMEYSSTIEYNRFRAEVDGTVAQILDSAQRREDRFA